MYGIESMVPRLLHIELLRCELQVVIMSFPTLGRSVFEVEGKTRRVFCLLRQNHKYRKYVL